jgi:hypothetical protein
MVHMRLGIVGSILAVLVFVSWHTHGEYPPPHGDRRRPGPPALQFLIVPLVDMFVFAILIGTALYFRRKLDVHKRLMLWQQ